MKLTYRVEINKPGFYYGCILFYFPNRELEHRPFSLYAANNDFRIKAMKPMVATEHLLNLLNTLELKFSFQDF